MTKSSPTSVTSVRRTVQAWETPLADHKRRPTRLLEETPQQRDQAALALATDLSAVLATEIEELCSYHHEFRIGMHRAFMRVLNLASRQDQQVVMFNEAVPGFTVLLFKKAILDLGAPGPETPVRGEKSAAKARPAAPVAAAESPEVTAAAVVVERFVQRTGNRVLVIEGDDAVFVFFPVADMRKNLREMGFYHTES